MARNPVRAATSAARNSRRFLRALDARAAAQAAQAAQAAGPAAAGPARPSVRVLGANREGVPDTEARVLAALSGWDIPAVAVSGVHVPITTGRGQTSAETDILLILPHGAITIEVKGLRRRVGGVLSCPVQGDWSIPGIDGDPVHSQQGGGPLEQVRRVMFGFKSFAETIIGAKVFVDGVVMVVPWDGLPLTLDKGQIPMPTGRDVLIADPTAADLRAWYTRRAARRGEAVWTAERAATMLDALGYTSTSRNPDTRISVAELAGLGFPSTTAAAWPTPAAEYPITLPTGPDPDPQYAPPPPARPDTRAPRARKRPPRASGRPRRGLARLAVALVLWAGVFGGGGAILLTTHHSLTPTVPTPTSTPTPTPTAPAGGPAGCYPLQPC